MKAPKCVMQVRPDKVAMICAWCPDKASGDKWAEEMGYEPSHGICLNCSAQLRDKKTEGIKVGVIRPDITEAELLRKLNGE